MGETKHMVDILLGKFEISTIDEAITEILGPKAFVKNVLTNTAQWASLIIAEDDGEYETSIKKCSQNCVVKIFFLSHTLLVFFIFFFNILHWLPPYSQRRYEEMNKDVSNYIEEMVYNWKSDAFCASFWLEWWQDTGIQALKCLEHGYKINHPQHFWNYIAFFFFFFLLKGLVY